MFQFFRKCIQNFGLFNGIQIYTQIKILQSGKLYLPGLKRPVFFRPRTSDIHTFREIFLREEYDITLSNSPQIIIDAGANVGFTTLFLIRKYPRAKIFSLEPDPENYELLKRNTEHYPNITILRTALWNKNGFIEVKDKGYGIRGFVVEDVNVDSRTAMPSITLPALMDRYNISLIDLLKIDIEGSEKEVFSYEFEKWLPVTKCLVIELHDRMKSGCSEAVLSALSHYNFERSIKGENLVFYNSDIMETTST